MPHQIPASELQELARAQYQKQEYQKALTTITEAIEASTVPSVALLNDRAAVYEKLGETNAALIDTRAAIRLDETNVISYKRAGRILQNINKHDKALEIYKRGLTKVTNKRANEDLRLKHDTLTRSLYMAHMAALPGVDPLEKLPIELVEMVFSYLSFPQIVNCTRVSKKWKGFMCGRPTLWQDPDFTKAKKLVPKSAIINCINRSRNQLRSVQLGRVARPEDAIIALTKSCHRMHTLQLENGDQWLHRWTSHLALATRLTHLTLGEELRICIMGVAQLLTLCPMLKSFTGLRVQGNILMDTMRFESDYHGLESLSLKADEPAIQTHFGPRAPVLGVGAWFTTFPHLRKLVINGFDMAATGKAVDLRHMEHLKHLDLRGGTAEAWMFPPSVEFLALEHHRPGVRHWMLPPYSVSKEHGLMLPNLKVLICGTTDDAALLLLTSLEGNPMECIMRGQSTGIGSKLESLHISDPADLRRLGFFDRLEDLVDLSLPKARTVDDGWAPWIAAHLHRLEKIDLESSDITGYGLKKILEAAPQMRSVNVKNCHYLSADASNWVRAKGIQINNSMEEAKRSGRKVRYW